MKKMIFILILGFGWSATAEPVCIKNGRQFYIELATKLGLKGQLSTYKRRFLELSNNLPKKGTMSEFGPSISSLIQLADGICTDYALSVAPVSDNSQTNVELKKSWMQKINNDIFLGTAQIDSYYYDRFNLPIKKDIVGLCLNYVTYYKNRTSKVNATLDTNKYCEDFAAQEFAKLSSKKMSSINENFIKELYSKLLGRATTANEISILKSAQVANNNEAVYASCIQIAASTEFIQNNKCNK